MFKRRVLVVGSMIVVFGAAGGRSQTARIVPASVEMGIDASMTSTEGITQGNVRARGGSFVGALGGLAGLELSGGYHHMSALDAADLEATVNWQTRFRDTASYPYVSVGGGVRYEDIGSFSQVLYPVGFGVGVRSLFGQRSGMRVEYRFRRILNDPSADFSEHSVLIGLSVFFRNSPAPGQASKEGQGP